MSAPAALAPDERWLPGEPGSRVMQVAMMVDDLHAACARWTATTGIGPFLTVPHVVLEEYDYRGAPAHGLDFSVAIAQWGGVQIELVEQHGEAPSAYRDTIAGLGAGGQGGFHHLAIYTDAYDDEFAAYAARGFVPSVQGSFGGFRFSYIDTHAAIGCMIELIEANPLQGDFFRRIAAAAEGWDGVTDPVRPGFPEPGDA